MSDKFEDKTPESSESGISRRRALARLGLGDSFAYAAPTLITLSLAANHGGDDFLGDAKPTSGASGPGKASGPSGPSGPSDGPGAIESEAMPDSEACGGAGQPPCQSQ